MSEADTADFLQLFIWGKGMYVPTHCIHMASYLHMGNFTLLKPIKETATGDWRLCLRLNQSNFGELPFILKPIHIIIKFIT